MVLPPLDRKQRRTRERRLAKARRKGRMKYIKYDAVFTDAIGQPVYMIDPDVAKRMAARDEALAKGQAKFNPPEKKATFADLLFLFVNNIPHDKDSEGKPTRKITIEDSGNAYEVIKAFRDAKDGVVEIEEHPYEWLLKLIDLDGPTAFPGSTAALIKERLQQLVPASEKPG